jgi:hypothetical protein
LARSVASRPCRDVAELGEEVSHVLPTAMGRVRGIMIKHHTEAQEAPEGVIRQTDESIRH